MTLTKNDTYEDSMPVLLRFKGISYIKFNGNGDGCTVSNKRMNNSHKCSNLENLFEYYTMSFAKIT